MTHKFTYESGSTVKSIELHEDANLSELLEEFKSYLQATGFYIHGDLEVVPDDYEVVKSEGRNTD